MSDSLQPHGLFAAPPGSFAHGKLQARVLEWVAITFSRRDLPDPGLEPMSLMSPELAGEFFFFTTSATWEARDHPLCLHVAF